MGQIEVINWQGKKVPAQHDQADKTIFVVEEVPQRNANLVMYPLESDPAGHFQKLGAFIRMDANMLKSRLSGRGFMMLTRSEKFEEVAACAGELNKAGYKARLMRDNMFFRIPAPHRVIGADFTAEGIDFRIAGSEQGISIPKGEPVFCVIGDLRSVKRLAEVKKSDKNPQPPPAPFSFSKILEKTYSYYCDIYAPYRWLAVRIESDKFSFSSLGAAATASSSENLAKLLDRFAAFPLKMVWDDRFAETALIGMRPQFEMAASATSLASASLTANADEIPFNFYSRFRYMLELACGLKCFG